MRASSYRRAAISGLSKISGIRPGNVDAGNRQGRSAIVAQSHQLRGAGRSEQLTAEIQGRGRNPHRRKLNLGNKHVLAARQVRLEGSCGGEVGLSSMFRLVRVSGAVYSAAASPFPATSPAQ